MSGTYQRNKQTFPQLHLQLLPPKYLTPCTINTGAANDSLLLETLKKLFTRLSRVR